MKSSNRSQALETRGFRSQKGAALIEALVALLIFAFGILGLFGLQGLMIRNQTDAKFRTDASFLANEVVGLAATDRVNIASYSTSTVGPCTYQRCADWVGKVTRGLPGGEASVIYTVATGDLSVTLAWKMPDGTRHQIVMDTIIR
jgi:type IV pilus assembly protein PilV